MSERKKVIPKQQKTVTPRQNKTVVPKWNVLEEGPNRVVLDITDFRKKDGLLDEAAVYRARQAYKGKTWGVEFEDKATGMVHRPRELYFDQNGSLTKPGQARLDFALAEGKRSRFYNAPSRDPNVSTWMQEEMLERVGKKPEAQAKAKPAAIEKISEHPKYKGIKISQKGNGPKKIFVEEAGGKRTYLKDEAAVKKFAVKKEYDRLASIFRNSKSLSERNLALSGLKSMSGDLPPALKRGVKEMTTVNDMFKEKKAKKQKPVKSVVVKKSQSLIGKQWDNKTPLRGSLRVSRSGKVYTSSAARVKASAASQERRSRRAEIQALKKEAFGRVKQIAKFNQSRIAKRARGREHSRKYRARVAVRNQTAFLARVQKAPKFGKAPLKMILDGKRWANRAAGKAAVMKQVGRDVMYPPMRHSGAKPLSPPVSMAGLRSGQSLEAPFSGAASKIRGTTVMSTTNTLSTAKYGGYGRGVFFRIDAQEVIANLVQRYPAVLQKAAVAVAGTIGRKLLDIVEPYVPKDKGLLYSTAQTNAGETSAGGVDIEGTEAYPSSQMYGVSISYNAPYAETVYFDESKRHGKEYNRYHGTSEKGEKETARWIEVAFREEGIAVKALLNEYSGAITAALNAVGMQSVSFKRASGQVVSFWKKG